MTDIGLILICSILLIGAIIATLGDRIGTRIGKKRLSLFNLRPKHTAILVTIFTGVIISATTLGILFASSKSLRIGIFQLDEIQKKANKAREDLEKTMSQKRKIEQELNQFKQQSTEAEKRLLATNQSLRDALNRQSSTEGKLKLTQADFDRVSQQIQKLRSELDQILIEKQRLNQQRNQIKEELINLKEDITEQKEQIAAKEKDIKKRDERITKQDQLIQDKNRTLAQAEQRLDNLKKQLLDNEKKLDVLATKLDRSEEDKRLLRKGNLALKTGQILTFRALRLTDPNQANIAIDQLLSEANRNAIELVGLNKGNTQRVVQISQTQVTQLANKIKDGKEYVIIIASAGNYLSGETQIQVFAGTVPNEVKLSQGTVIPGSTIDPQKMDEKQIRNKVEDLIANSGILARRSGIISNQIIIGDGTNINLLNFIEKIRQSSQRLELQAIIKEDITTISPLKIQLEAVSNGKVLFST